jgi:hypothetical protein
MIQRRLNSLERSFYRALHQLQRTRTPDPPQSDALPRPVVPAPASRPGEIGFVPQTTLRNPAATADLCPTLRHLPQICAAPNGLSVENSNILGQIAQFDTSGPFGPDLANPLATDSSHSA